MNNVISFPYIGSYYIPIRYIIKKITKCEVIISSLNNDKTVAIGSKYSPNDICMPFKYILGNNIYALVKGANILIYAGCGCQYGYFAKLQEKILEDLGYNFIFVNLIKNNHISIKKFYQFAKSINSKLNFLLFVYYIIQGFLIVFFMDELDKYKRTHQALAINKEVFNVQKNRLIKEYSKEDLSIKKTIKIYLKYRKIYKLITTNEKIKPIKILLIGDTFSLIDSDASNNLENKLLDKGIIVYRYTDLTYLLLKKKLMQQKVLSTAKKYIKYRLGVNGTESIAHTIEHCKKGIDGIIHIKSYGCVQELNAIPILSKVCEDYKVPIIFLSHDGRNDITNIDTKLEVFYEMIKQKKIKKKIQK